MKKIYFSNLDGFRFLCFLSVFFFHSFATQNSSISNDPTYIFIKRQLFGNGNLGVNFFFVLSGFLITYLLLKEKEKHAKINIKHFYFRRILRIWPLYFLCLFLGFVIFPLVKYLFGGVPNETAHPFNYIAFLSNFDFIKYKSDSSILSNLWSVSVEEQFYLVWPIIIAAFDKRRLPMVFLAAILLSFFFRLYNYNNPQVVEKHTLSCISDLCVGGLGAYLSLYAKKFAEFTKKLSPVSIFGIYALCIALFFFRLQLIGTDKFMIASDRLVVSILFVMIILEQNYSNRSLFKMGRYKWISKLGYYTYGLYCLHRLGLLGATIIAAKLHTDTTLWGLIVSEIVISLTITLLLAYLSFHYLEKPFLQLKRKFEVVKTGESDAVAFSFQNDHAKPLLEL